MPHFLLHGRCSISEWVLMEFVEQSYNSRQPRQNGNFPSHEQKENKTEWNTKHQYVFLDIFFLFFSFLICTYKFELNQTQFFARIQLLSVLQNTLSSNKHRLYYLQLIASPLSCLACFLNATCHKQSRLKIDFWSGSGRLITFLHSLKF